MHGTVPTMADLSIDAPLYFIRHGETDWNLEKRFQGQTDIPLNVRGKLQALENAALLEKAATDIDQLSFISSPLSRAIETTEIILQASKIANSRYAIDDSLTEISFGLWEGLTPAEAKQQYYQQRQRRRADRWTIAPPEGESFVSRVTAIRQFLTGVTANSVIVSHSGIMRIIFQLLLDTPPREAVRLEIPNIGVSVWDGKGLNAIKSCQ